MLVAATNVGKTTLALNLALSLAAGKALPPLTRAADVRRVLYIDGETSCSRFQWNIQKMLRIWGADEENAVKDNLNVACDPALRSQQLNLSKEEHL